MGRSPCCDKLGLKKGPWTPEEDQKLLAYIEEHGHGNWRALPSKAGLQRCGKSCRLRWTNYLRPDIKRGKFSLQEEQTIIQLHALLGNRWSAIATHLPKRTDNEIKNYWNTHLKKRLTKMGIDPVTHKPKNEGLLSTCDGGQQSKNAATLSHMAQWESARLEAEARLVRQSKLRSSPSSSPSLITTHNPHPIINSFDTTTNNNVNNNNNNNNTSRDDSNSNGTNIMPRCLDVLKVWNHSNSGGTITTTPAIELGLIRGGGGSRGLGLDSSPTSTLSFSENGPLLLQGPTTIGPAVIEFMEHGINDNRSNNSSSQVEQELGKEKEKTRVDYDNGRYSLSFSASSELNDVMESNDNNDKSNYDDEVVDDDDKVHDQDHQQSFMEGFTQLLLGGATVLNNSNNSNSNNNNEKSQIEEVEVEDEGGSHRGSSNNNNKSNNGRGCNSSSSCSDYYEDNKNYWNTILNLVNSSPSHSPMF